MCSYLLRGTLSGRRMWTSSRWLPRVAHARRRDPAFPSPRVWDSSMHHVLKISSSANNTHLIVPDLLPLPSTNATYHTACRQPPGVVLWPIYVDARLHRVCCCILCGTPLDSFILHTTTDWCRLYSSYSCTSTYINSVRTHHVASDAHVEYSRACVIYICFSSANTLVPDFLPLPIHQ